MARYGRLTEDAESVSAQLEFEDPHSASGSCCRQGSRSLSTRAALLAVALTGLAVVVLALCVGFALTFNQGGSDVDLDMPGNMSTLSVNDTDLVTEEIQFTTATTSSSTNSSSITTTSSPTRSSTSDASSSAAIPNTTQAPMTTEQTLSVSEEQTTAADTMKTETVTEPVVTTEQIISTTSAHSTISTGAVRTAGELRKRLQK